MRNPIGYIALSLLAAAFAGCSSTDTGTNSSPSAGGDLTGALAQYNAEIKPLANTCVWDATGSKATYNLAASEIAVLSLRTVDSALMANGVPCTYTDSTTHLSVTVINKNLKALAINGQAGSNETAIFDIRNGLFAKGAITVDLKTKSGSSGTDEVAVLGTTSADKIACALDSTGNDNLDFGADKTADVAITKTATDNNHVTIDLGDGADTFTQGDCKTASAIYGGAGADTITVGSDKHSGDLFSGGTDTGTDASVDIISYASRSAGVTVTFDTTTAVGTANDGDIATTEADNVFDDFEVLTGGDGNDVLTTGTHVAAGYTINAGAGDDTMASGRDHGTVFNGGTGIDTVTYAARTAAVTVTMDGTAANDGEKSAAATATLDNVKGDVENLIGTTLGDTITGNALPNVITPGTGNDTVTGGDGDDVFVAADADGDDKFIGGNGTDTADYSVRTTSVCLVLDGVVTSGVFGGTHSGACTVVAGTPAADPDPAVAPSWPALSSTEADILGADVENAVGTTASDHIIGNALSNNIYGMGGSDKLEGKAGVDFVDGNLYTSTAGYKCDPVTFECRGTVNGSPACDCSTTTAWVATCPHATLDVQSVFDCGGDSLDVASCASGVAAQFTACWKTQ